MIKASLAVMAVLTFIIATGLRWREERMAQQPRMGFVAAQKRKVNRWVTAAAIAAIGTSVILGGLHWLRVIQG